MFSPEYFCPNHQRFARTISKISVTGGAAAPLAPPARTPMTATASSKAKSRCTIYRERAAFFRRRKCKIRFVRRTTFVWHWNIQVEPSPFLLSYFFLEVQRLLDKSDKSPIRCNWLIFSCSLSPATILYDSVAVELLPCFSVFLIYKRFFNRNFWSACT